ncbi:hypothetical protein RFI_30693, partial [Reticulomyxa filosa]
RHPLCIDTYLPYSGFEIYVKVVSGVDAPREEDGLKCTNGGERQWTNTIDLRLVNVDASSLISNSAQLSALCGCASMRFVTKTHHKSLIIIGIKIRLSHYKLEHYKSCDKEQLNFLVLEVSDDVVAWIILRQHADDKALRKAGMAQKWPIETSTKCSSTDCPCLSSSFKSRRRKISRTKNVVVYQHVGPKPTLIMKKIVKWGTAPPSPKGVEKGLYICVYFFIYYNNMILFVIINRHAPINEKMYLFAPPPFIDKNVLFDALHHISRKNRNWSGN